MAGSNLNRVVITGNLTREPELRSTPAGTAVCRLRVACNTRRKDSSGEWVDRPNYFDVTVWGARGENCATYLAKGRPVAIDGRLEWREWQDKDTGQTRQAVSIVADSVQFLGARDQNGPPARDTRFTSAQEVPADSAGLSAAEAGDDLPSSQSP